MDRINKTFIMALNFFEEVNEFEKEPEANEAGYKKKCGKHKKKLEDYPAKARTTKPIKTMSV